MLGEHVRNIRKKRGITLKELAEKTGLSIGYISQIERDLTDPSLSTLRKLSAALDIQIGRASCRERVYTIV